jgi:hypothetical protein
MQLMPLLVNFLFLKEPSSPVKPFSLNQKPLAMGSLIFPKIGTCQFQGQVKKNLTRFLDL